MDFDKILDELKNYFSFEIIVAEKDDKLLHTQTLVNAKNYFKGNILIQMFVHSTGTTHILMTFEEMEKNYENLLLVNNFNEKSPFLKGYISDMSGKSRFEIHSTNNCKDEMDVASNIERILEMILEPQTLELLNPIIDATVIDNTSFEA